MTIFIPLLIAFSATLALGIVARFGLGLFIADWQTRAAGVFVPMGFAMARYSYAGPPTLDTVEHVAEALAAIFAIIILWRSFLRKKFEQTAN